MRSKGPWSNTSGVLTKKESPTRDAHTQTKGHERTQTESGHPQVKERGLHRHDPGWHLDLGLPASWTAAAAKSLQSCPTLCNPIDSIPPGSPIPGIFQARTLEWVAISFSSAWKWKVKMKSLGHVRLFVTPWTTAYQAPPSMGFPRQEYWSGVTSPSPPELLENKFLLFKPPTCGILLWQPYRRQQKWFMQLRALKLLYH